MDRNKALLLGRIGKLQLRVCAEYAPADSRTVGTESTSMNITCSYACETVLIWWQRPLANCTPADCSTVLIKSAGRRSRHVQSSEIGVIWRSQVEPVIGAPAHRHLVFAKAAHIERPCADGLKPPLLREFLFPVELPSPAHRAGTGVDGARDGSATAYRRESGALRRRGLSPVVLPPASYRPVCPQAQVCSFPALIAMNFSPLGSVERP